MKRILSALTLSAVLASPAWSGFTNNKSEWDELLPAHQVGFVIGVVDQMITPFGGETRSDKQYRLKTHTCLSEASLSPDGLREMIDTMYRNDVSSWSTSPYIMLRRGIEELCH
jgi:hypothetical protein